MNKEETINDIKSYYYVITSQLDNLELSRYLMKIPTTYFATFPYVEHYKQLQSQLATYKDKEDKIKEYCETIKEKYKFFHESNTTDVSAILEIIGDE